MPQTHYTDTPKPTRPASNTPRSQSAQPRNVTWTVRRKTLTAPSIIPTRKYDLLWRAPNGDILDKSVMAPALNVFEEAFGAFAHGSLIPTSNGPIAVEDLLPGDQVETCDGSLETITWIGAMQLDTVGQRATNAAPERLYRVTSDGFEYARPAPDLVLGKAARYLHRAAALKSYLGTDTAMAPISCLADGQSVIEVTPISSVRTYHICLARHQLIHVNGLDLETFHPGPTVSGQLMGSLHTQYMNLFPHLSDLTDFGAMIRPRLSAGDLVALNAA